MEYILLFLEGIITFISPCILPMVPIYISYFMGEQEEGSEKNKILINSLCFVAGFTLIFTLLGGAASSIGLFFSTYMREINIVSGILMIIFGLNHIGIFKIGLLQRSFKVGNNQRYGKSTKISTFIFGVIFGIGWTPCVGPFLGSALMIAANSNNSLQGVFMLLTYSLGLGIPFVISALLIDSLKNTFNFIKRNYNIINKISGAILVIIGVMMITGYFNLLLSMLAFN